MKPWVKRRKKPRILWNSACRTAVYGWLLNTNLKELILPRYSLQLQLAFYQQGTYTRAMVISIILPTQLYYSAFTSFRRFIFSIFSSLITPLIFLLSTKTSYNKLPDLKASSRLGWPNIFKCFRVTFSLKKKIIQFPLSFSLYFQQKRAPKLSSGHLPTKRSSWAFDVTNRTNGFSSFQTYHEVIMYLFSSLAKSCTLFWKYSNH